MDSKKAEIIFNIIFRLVAAGVVIIAATGAWMLLWYIIKGIMKG